MLLTVIISLLTVSIVRTVAPEYDISGRLMAIPEAGRSFGCYKDHRKPRDLPELFDAGNKTTRQFCLNYCKSKGFKFFGVQAMNWCTCGNSFGRHGQVRDSECNMLCAGDSSETCGSDWRNDIFGTGLTKETFVNPSLGCYVDKEEVRDMPEIFNAGRRTSRWYCLIHCRTLGYKYMGLQAQSYCTCGNRFGHYGTGLHWECRDTCKGDPVDFCGSAWRNEIFVTLIAPESFTRIGCYVDKADNRDLALMRHYGNHTTMQVCLSYCQSNGYRYFALQAGDWCLCGSSYGRFGKARDSECNIKCKGDTGTLITVDDYTRCGGILRNEIFDTGLVPADTMDARRLGCFLIGPNDEFPAQRLFGNHLTPHLCMLFCESLGARYFGLGFGKICYCDSHLRAWTKVDDRDCNYKCTGDANKTCGAVWKRELFDMGAIPNVARYVGCFVDSADRDMVQHKLLVDHSIKYICKALCKDQGYMYFGLQAKTACFCGNSYGRHGRASDSDCYLPCLGDSGTTCGGYWRNEVYDTDLVEDEPHRMGCFIDKETRDLTERLSFGHHNTRQVCLVHCRSKGFKYFGLQASDWCGCGNTYGRYGQVDDSECRTHCTGDWRSSRYDTCGGYWRNEIFRISHGANVLFRIGCYNVQSDGKEMSEVWFTSDHMTRDLCVTFCLKESYRYIGLVGGSWCGCGNSYGSHEKVRDSECSRICPGDMNNATFCGGLSRTEIFDTGDMVLKTIEDIIG